MANEYKNQLITSFIGRVDKTFTQSVNSVATSLNGLTKSTKQLSGAGTAIGKVGSQSKSAATNMGFLSGATNSVVGAFKTLARFAAAGAVFKTISSAITGSVTAIIEYDQALKNLQAITGATSTEVIAFGDKMIDVSNNTKFSAQEVAQAMVYLGQSGFSARESLASIDAIASVATGTLSDFATTADLFTSTLRAFQLEATESGRAADVFASAVNKSKLTIQGLRTIFNYVGASAKQAGLSIEETATAAGILANNGLRMSTVGTSMRNVISRMIAPSAKLKRELYNVGLSVDDINPRFVGFRTAMQNMTKILIDQRTGVADAGKAYELFGLRGQQAANVFVKAFTSSDYDTLLENIKKPGEAFKQQLIQQQGLGVQTKNLMDRLANLGIIMGELGLTGIISGLVEKLSALVLGFGQLLSYVNRNIDGLQILSGDMELAGKYLVKYTNNQQAFIAGMEQYRDAIKAINESDSSELEKKNQLALLVKQLTERYPGLAEALEDTALSAEKLDAVLHDKQKQVFNETTDYLKKRREEIIKELDRTNKVLNEKTKGLEKATDRASSFWSFGSDKEISLYKKSISFLTIQRLALEDSLGLIDETLKIDVPSFAKSTRDLAAAEKALGLIPQEVNKQWNENLKKLGPEWRTVVSDAFKSKDPQLIQDVIDYVEKALNAASTAISQRESLGFTILSADKEKIEAEAINAVLKKFYDKQKNRNKEKIQNLKSEQSANDAAIKEELSTEKTKLDTKLEYAELEINKKNGTNRQLLKAQQKSLDEELSLIKENFKERIKEWEDYNAKIVALGGKPQTGRLLKIQEELNTAIAKNQLEQAKLSAKVAKDMEENPENLAEAWVAANKKIKESATTTWKKISDMAVDMADTFADSTADAFIEFVKGTKNAADAFSDMALSIIQDITKIIIKQQIMNALSGASEMFGNYFNLGSSVNYGETASTATQLHSGGMAGKASAIKRALSPTAFINAPRFHDGGEVNAVLKRGEVVQTKEQAASSREPRDVKVIVENRTGTQVGSASASSSFDMGTEVIRIVIDGINRNKQGLRKTIATAK
jgi:TP901 family phage tail tape measure protein